MCPTAGKRLQSTHGNEPMPRILAIDPGLTGALVEYDTDLQRLWVHDIPTTTLKKRTRVDLPRLSYLLAAVGCNEVLVEQVGSMPMQGGASAFNFGFTAGAIHGLLIGHGFTVHTATPQQWKFGVGLNAVPGQDQKARKNASRARAQELFPEYASLFARVKDDGRAEAALMARWFANKRKQA